MKKPTISWQKTAKKYWKTWKKWGKTYILDKIGLEGVGSGRRKGSESAAEISRMGIRAEVGWSIWREQVTGLAERILLRISMGWATTNYS